MNTVTNLCKDLHHLGVVGLTYVKELPPPLFGINQEQPLLLSRPLLLQRLLMFKIDIVKQTSMFLSKMPPQY